MKTVSVVIPTYNEIENIQDGYVRVKGILDSLSETMARTRKVTSIKEEILKQEAVAKSKEKYDAEVKKL